MTEKKSILLRLSPEEYERITQLANKSVFSREEFIRQILQEATIVERPPAEVIDKVFWKNVLPCSHPRIADF